MTITRAACGFANGAMFMIASIIQNPGGSKLYLVSSRARGGEIRGTKACTFMFVDGAVGTL